MMLQEDHWSVNEASFFNKHRKESEFKSLLQAIVGILKNTKALRCK